MPFTPLFSLFRDFLPNSYSALAEVLIPLLTHSLIAALYSKVPLELGGYILYFGACVCIGIALYYFFTSGMQIPTDIMNGSTQGINLKSSDNFSPDSCLCLISTLTHSYSDGMV